MGSNIDNNEPRISHSNQASQPKQVHHQFARCDVSQELQYEMTSGTPSSLSTWWHQTQPWSPVTSCLHTSLQPAAPHHGKVFAFFNPLGSFLWSRRCVVVVAALNRLIERHGVLDNIFLTAFTRSCKNWFLFTSFFVFFIHGLTTGPHQNWGIGRCLEKRWRNKHGHAANEEK